MTVWLAWCRTKLIRLPIAAVGQIELERHRRRRDWSRAVLGSEIQFVRWLRDLAGVQGRGLRLGIGDDAALVTLRGGRELILTADMCLEGVHFRRSLHPARSVGHRALARSLSDIAAMGGNPRYALLSLAISEGTSREWVRDFYAGMLALARRFGVLLVGGDTAKISGKTMMDVVVAGETLSGRALRRSGARSGDQIFVSDRLGLSAWGLELLKAGARHLTSARAVAVRAHLYPVPQLALARFFAAHRLPSALMDVSDGLSADLARLCEASQVGARLWADRLPGPPGLSGEKSLTLALHGGEDYQLLFTVPPAKVSRLPTRYRGVPLHRIGEIEERKGLRLVGADGKARPLKAAGWDYFRKLS